MKTSIFSNDYFRLFVTRESKVVLGKHCTNLWILSVMLALTFFAIAFSTASLEYLSVKMNDPFINWVNIQNDGDGNMAELRTDLGRPEVQETFHFCASSMDYKGNMMFYAKDKHRSYYPNCLFFESFTNNPLLTAILSPDNIFEHCALPYEDLSDEMIGLIVTRSLLDTLGYKGEKPSFINMCKGSIGADALGFELEDSKFGYLPMPIMAIVERLPMNMDIVSTKFLYEQWWDDYQSPFNLNKQRYVATLNYFVPTHYIDSAKFRHYLNGFDECITQIYPLRAQKLFTKGFFVQLEGDSEDLNWRLSQDLNKQIMERYESLGLVRVYDYDYGTYHVNLGDFMSVQFNNLQRVTAFASYIKKYNVKIEMAQINSKENFNAVSLLALILTWVIVAFSILCVVLFVVNLLQSYFQKVKRNMGTFKAFGMGNRELISVYMLIVTFIVIASIVISLFTVLVVKEGLDICGILKDGHYSYLSLLNWTTISAAMIILCCSAVTVYGVMHRQLTATPGDLIYDR